MQSILTNAIKKHNLILKDYAPLSGSVLNKVFKVTTEEKEYVIKLNSALKTAEMFHAEALGLQLLQKSNSFKVPEVIAHGTENSHDYLIIEYISTGKHSKNFWRQFAEGLAQLHQNTDITYGLDHDNFIGTLPQYNSPETSAADFYINQRLIPQFRMAIDKGFDYGNLSVFYKAVSEIIPNSTPSLLHGDLWNGNYLVSAKGEPVLIDPAVVYGPREMDLAMMQLFGGFPSEVFLQYNEIFPLQDDWEQRTSLFQLYYVLVHINLFGGSYYEQAKEIISTYS